MESIITFFIKASAGIALFYLVYWIFLRKETFYKANRWFLIMALITAVLLPLFPVRYSVLVDPDNGSAAYKTFSDTFKAIPAASGLESNSMAFKWEQALLFIYITGASIFLLRLLSQTIILLHLLLKSRIKSSNGVRIVENNKYGLPFSFFNIVFINPKFHTQENLPEILAHEEVHIRENHWFDLLFTELLTVIFWFNPFIWFFERSIKQNHEYLADKGVLAQGHAMGRYQALLINQLMGMQIIGITNNLNFALNTNRLKMMTKKTTPARRRIKFMWALPAVTLLLFAFAQPDYQAINKMDPGIKSAGSTAPKEVNISGIVVDENEEPLSGVSIIIKGTTSGTVSDRDGTFSLKASEDDNIVFSYVGKETVAMQAGSFTSGERKRVKMKDGVIQVDLDKNLKEEFPSPPPPSKMNENEVRPSMEKAELPAPPPPPAKAEKQGKEETFVIVEDLPEYKGGYTALEKDISEMYLKAKQNEKNVSGNALIGYTVNEKGKVTEVKVIEADNELAGKTAAGIVSNMKDWKPGSQRGKPVPVKMVMPFTF